jgi:hypothetical protein
MAAGGAARGTYAEQGPLGEGLQEHPTREGDIRRFAEVDGRRRLRDEGTEGRVVSLAGEVLGIMWSTTLRPLCCVAGYGAFDHRITHL